MNKYDIIGDIHGHAQPLCELLKILGYRDYEGTFKHPTRKALFVGDYIDRGPEIRKTLQIVRSMVEDGSAIALMGNHEYNAICYNTQRKDGTYLRSHTVKNQHQHSATLSQFEDHEEEYLDYINWFKTLPLWYEDDHIRAVHACWDQSNIDRLSELLVDQRLDEAAIHESAQEGTDLHQLIEETLKGKEMEMPEGEYFHDKDGHKRHHIRIKWWLNQKYTTYQNISVIPMDDKLSTHLIQEPSDLYYKESEKPIFFGHYWLQGEPNLYRDNICCLDYSIAKKGCLAAYSYDGESILSNEKFSAITENLEVIK